MKNKIIHSTFLLIFFFTTNLQVQALTLKCPEVSSPEEEVNCQIENETISGLKANIELSSSMSYQSLIPDTPWKNYYNTKLGFALGNISSSPFHANLSLKVAPSTPSREYATVTLKNIEISTSEFQNTSLEPITSRIKILSNNNNLKSLEVSNEKIKPDFEKTITTYQLTTKKEIIEISATPEDEQAKVEGNIGTQKLALGTNKLEINVTSERGNRKNYIIYVTRMIEEQNKIDSTALKSLIINKKPISLQKNKYHYSQQVENKEEIPQIEAIPLVDSSKVQVIAPEKYSIGENEIKIKVTAEDGTTATYLILVNRNKLLSTDSSLKNIVIENYPFQFSSNTYQYNLTIKDEKSLKITVTTNSAKAKYKILGNHNLKNNSVIRILVTAEDGTNSTYQIKITKDNSAPSSILFTQRIKIQILLLTIFFLIIILGIKIRITKTRKNKR